MYNMPMISSPFSTVCQMSCINMRGQCAAPRPLMLSARRKGPLRECQQPSPVVLYPHTQWIDSARNGGTMSDAIASKVRPSFIPLQQHLHAAVLRPMLRLEIHVLTIFTEPLRRPGFVTTINTSNTLEHALTFIAGNDPDQDPDREPEPPTKVIDRPGARSGKRNPGAEAPGQDAPRAPGGGRGGRNAVGGRGDQGAYK